MASPRPHNVDFVPMPLMDGARIVTQGGSGLSGHRDRGNSKFVTTVQLIIATNKTMKGSLRTKEA